MPEEAILDERPINALLWPLLDAKQDILTFNEIFIIRNFSVFFLFVNWIIVLTLGYGSTRNCSDTWQLEMMCNAAMYANKIFTEPNEFILSWFTGVWFNNGLDHIIYVTCGILIFVQSFEMRMGTKNTLFLFFSGTAVVSTICAIIINYGYVVDPSNEIFSHGMDRNWMGGSVGIFSILGAIFHCSKRPLALFIPVLLFEIWNGQTNISIQTSSAHMLSLLYGYVAGYYIQKRWQNSALS